MDIQSELILSLPPGPPLVGGGAWGEDKLIFVKTSGLLQPYFGHFSCMPVVCVTHYFKGMLPVFSLNEDLLTESL